MIEVNTDNRVSVIIPTYNRAHSIVRSIESVLSQTYSNFEIIVIDDGSIDRTKEVLRPYMSKIIYLYQENKGASAARNAGVKIAKGEWIAFLDSDDCWLPEKLHRQIMIIHKSKTELGCVICNMGFYPQVGKNTNSFQNACFTPKPPQGLCWNMSSILLTRFIMFNQGAIIKKNIFNKAGGYDERLKILEDYDIALKLSFLCNVGYETTPFVIYQTDTKDSLSSNSNTSKETKQIIKILENLKTFLDMAGVPKPELLDKQIKYYKFLFICCGNKYLSFVVRVIKAISRRSPFYPRPNCEAIVI
ncbi:glycosyl transferase [Desulfocapsa sulfexigens DSM 10523]|uniref:Glycosyl transferase n=1 Tax=Desulfocapsa sulfexigens (strain DSM 10523 / SB164P1) TaxID=1167006 RepID=M1PK37_DESSD|nr:glycosyltransferase [Desulfocapsa sulfexigens]AGF79905.1 glycosyl transferase [Desulfocapsa sulfexigens DSM 10523]